MHKTIATNAVQIQDIGPKSGLKNPEMAGRAPLPALAASPTDRGQEIECVGLESRGVTKEQTEMVRLHPLTARLY